MPHILSRFISPLLVASLLLFSPSAAGYAVLTHELLIDLSWNSSIVPFLLSRFPSLTPEELRRAHAYAYGGCVIQDLGYYPFANTFFSNLTHYVRSGDFVRALFRHAHTANEVAFAIGALTHYIGDSIGHSEATNPSVAITFPALRAKYGPSVNYAEDKTAHGQVEFAFDINQITKGHMPPSDYLRFIGLNVPRRQLGIAFYETYGLNIRDVLGLYRPTLRTYRFGVRSFLPAFAYAEALLHRNRFPADTPGPEFDVYAERVGQVKDAADWQRYRRKPRVVTYLLAGLIVILPKIGPIAMLSIKGPTSDTEKRYIESVNRSTAALRLALHELRPDAAPNAVTEAVRNGGAGPSPEAAGNRPAAVRLTLPANVVPNRDLDTGNRVVPGGYPLTDKTYAKLLATVTKNPTWPVPAGLKADIFRYYADPDAPIFTKRKAKQWAQAQNQLQLLTAIPITEGPE